MPFMPDIRGIQNSASGYESEKELPNNTMALDPLIGRRGSAYEAADDFVSIDHSRIPERRTSIVSAGVSGFDPDIQVYKKRWYILTIYAVAVTLQDAYWNVFGPIASSAKVVYGWENWHIALLTNWGPITYVLTMVPTSWLLKSKGIRYPTLVAMGLVLLGAICRCLPLDKQWYTYSANLGAILNGMAGPAVIAGPTTLSAAWFPPRERTLATSISTFAIAFGIALSFLIGPELVPGGPCAKLNDTILDPGGGYSNCTVDELAREEKDIMLLMYIEAAVAGAFFILAVIYFPNLPPKPPSITAGVKREESFRMDLIQAISNVNLWIIAFTFALTVAMSSMWLTAINVLWTPLGISQQEAGWIGFIATVVGAVANPVCAKLADEFQRRMKMMLLIINVLSTGFCWWVVLMTVGYLPLTKPNLYISVISCIALLSAASPLYLEIGCEIGYPVSEALSSGLITFVFNFMSVLFLSVFFVPNLSTDWMNWLFGGCMAVSIPLLIALRAGYNRLSVDELGVDT